jgi:hypothetical protein
MGTLHQSKTEARASALDPRTIRMNHARAWSLWNPSIA